MASRSELLFYSKTVAGHTELYDNNDVQLTNDTNWDSWFPSVIGPVLCMARTPRGTLDKTMRAATISALSSSTSGTSQSATISNDSGTGTAWSSLTLPFCALLDTGANVEMVKVTAYNSGTGAATITRDVLGTGAPSHSAGTVLLGGYNALQIWTATRSGGSLTKQKDFPSVVNATWTAYGHPILNPAGTECVIFVQTTTGYAIVQLDTTDYSNKRTAYAVASPAGCVDPQYSPDGNTIVFTEAAALITAISRCDVTGALNAGHVNLWKQVSITCKSTGNVDITSAPSTVDGVTLSSGNTILLASQTNQTQNGVYTFSSAGAALTRNTGFDTGAEILGGSVQVILGTVNAQTYWECANLTPPTLGSTNIAYTQRSRAVLVGPNDPMFSADGTKIAVEWEAVGVDGSHPAGQWDIGYIPYDNLNKRGGPLTITKSDGNIWSRPYPSLIDPDLWYVEYLAYPITTAFQIATVRSDGSGFALFKTSGESHCVATAPGLPGLMVECAFGYAPLVDTLPVWTDVTDYVQAIDITRGRDPQLGSFPTGTATLTLKNDDYRFDPDNSSSPYAPYLRPVTPVRVSVNSSDGTVVRLFTGYVAPRNGWVQSYQADGNSGVTTVNCVDFLAVLATMQLPTTRSITTYTSKILVILGQLKLIQVPVVIDQPVATYAGQLTTSVLSNLITDTVIPQPIQGWSVGSGIVHSQGFFGAENALTWVQNLAATEGGLVYVLGDGTVHFDGRYSIITDTRSTTSQVTFSDIPSGAEVPYSVNGFAKTYAAQVYNKATVTIDNGEPYTLSDTSSISAYTQTDYQQSGSMQTAADALQQAQFVLDQYATPVSCPASLTVFPLRGDTALDAAVLRELRDRVTVKRKPPGAAAQVSASVFVEKIHHAIKPTAADWSCDLTFSTADTIAFTEGQTYFTLGTSALDGTDILGF